MRIGFPAMTVRHRIRFACEALARKRKAKRKNPKERDCMRCNRRFRPPAGTENRLCDWCNRMAERSSGAMGIATFAYGSGYGMNEGSPR